MLAVFLIGCAGSSPVDLVAAAHPPVEHVVTPTITVTVIPVPDAPDGAGAPDAIAVPAKHDDAPYGAEIHSVRMLKGTILYKTPSIDADRVGVIRKGARAGFLAAAPAGGGCDARWIQLAPRGWACETALEPTTDAAPATATAPPALADLIAAEDTSPVPPVRGVYGVVRGKNVQAYASTSDAAAGNGRVLVGKNSVRSAGAVTINGKRTCRRGSAVTTTRAPRSRPARPRRRAAGSTASSRRAAWSTSSRSRRTAGSSGLATTPGSRARTCGSRR